MLALDAVLFEQVLSICWTTRRSTRHQIPRYRSGACAIGLDLACMILEKATAFAPAELGKSGRQILPGAEGDHVRPGTGLGLAISRASSRRCMARISAGNRADRAGAVLTDPSSVPAAADTLDTAA